MKNFQKIIIAVATATFFILLWKINLAEVGRYLSQVGWGMLLIVLQESVAHGFNTWGWRYTFPAREAESFPFKELFKLRITGDAVNYLTPSATIAGEFVRAVHLNASHDSEIRYASVAVAKLTQALAQAVFIITGLILVLNDAVLSAPSKALFGTLHISHHQSLVNLTKWGLCGLLLALAAYGYWAWRGARLEESAAPSETLTLPSPLGRGNRHYPSWLSSLGAVPRQCRRYFRRHPGRFALSCACFLAGYAWGIFEAYWICRFLGVIVSIKSAFTIQVLGTLIDGMLFMVPAKVGTQEAGKTLIFSALGFQPSLGFAFGVLRHIRELCWAGFGLLLYAADKAHFPQALPLSSQEDVISSTAEAMEATNPPRNSPA